MNGRSGMRSVALRPHLPVGLPFIEALDLIFKLKENLAIKLNIMMIGILLHVFVTNFISCEK